MKKEILKSVASLTAIAVICTVILVVANHFLKTEPSEGLSPELIAKLENIAGEGNYVEVDTNGIDLDSTVINVYRNEDSKNLVFNVKGVRTPSEFAEVLVGVKDNKVLGVDTKSIQGGLYSQPFTQDVYNGLIDKDIDGIPTVAELKDNIDLSKLITGATESAGILSDAVKLALNSYSDHSDALVAAAAKSTSPVTVELSDRAPQLFTPEGSDEDAYRVFLRISSTNAKLFDPTNAREGYTYKVTFADETKTYTASVIRPTAAKKGDTSVDLTVIVNTSAMGEYKLTLDILNAKNEKVVHTQAIDVLLAEPQYVDIKEWLDLESYDAIQALHTDDADDVNITIFEITDGTDKSFVGYSTLGISGDGFSATLRVYVSIDADGKITGVNVINVEYADAYNNVKTDSLDGVDINDPEFNPETDLGLEQTKTGATKTTGGAENAVKAIISVFKDFQAAEAGE